MRRAAHSAAGGKVTGPVRHGTSRPTTLARLATLALLCTALSACGYALVGRSSSLPEDIQKIYIEPLKNQTARSQVDLILTQALTDEFVTRRRFTIVGSRSEADAELSGIVNAFNVRPVTFNPDGRADEYEIQIYAQVEFRRVDDVDPEVIWERDNYVFRENYEVAAGTGTFTALEDEAITEVADKFAETLVIDVLEGF